MDEDFGSHSPANATAQRRRLAVRCSRLFDESGLPSVAPTVLRIELPYETTSLYFASRTSNAGRVPSKTSTMWRLIAGFSMAPVVYVILLPPSLSISQ